MNQATDPYRFALECAARERLIAAIAAVSGGISSLLQMEWQFTTAPEKLLWGTLFSLPPAWLLVWCLWSRASLRRVGDRLSDLDAYDHWGRFALGDAVALVPMATLVVFSALILGPPLRFSRMMGPLITGVVVIGACAIHLISLPNALNRVRRQDGARAEKVPVVPPGDVVRSTFRRLASYRLACTALAAFSAVLPWAYRDVLLSAFPWSNSGVRSSAGEMRVVLGLEVLSGVGGDLASLGAWECAASVLVLAALSVWELRRGRWPAAPSFSQTRVFVAWAMIIAASSLPMIIWVGMTVGFIRYVSPLHVGGWVSLVAMVACVVVLLAFTPLRLMLALRSRSERDHQDHLAERGQR